eukprot:7909893-Lingulodinium_polyedra.AAC.1
MFTITRAVPLFGAPGANSFVWIGGSSLSSFSAFQQMWSARTSATRQARPQPIRSGSEYYA